MRCVNCQNEMNLQERYCSKCGNDSFVERAQPPLRPRTYNWDTHVRVLAWIFIGSALFMLFPALTLTLSPGMMWTRMPHGPFSFMGPIFFSAGLALVSIPVISILTGIGLLRYRDWARVLALIQAVFMLIGFPFGTAIGIYAFWVLLSAEGSASYRRNSISGRRSGGSEAFPPYRGA